ncbi:DNA-directed RNA polymerase subunit H [Candidatus Woesearchaeota archaeon]|nr:DNA-directed RNA polymerase subunit H [Candidatus Woesearchaeota archaeon]
MAKKTFDVNTHALVPEHIVLSEKEKNQIFEKYSISFKELPKILANDPVIKQLKLKSGDVIKIVKKSPTAGIAEYYRGVISE